MTRGLLVIILIAFPASGLKVSGELCRTIEEMTVCHDLPLKRYDPLEIENCTKILKLEPPLKEIPPRVFVKLSGLETLVINFTLMKKIDSHAFDGLNKLQTLDLYFNQLSDIPLEAFHGCPSLTYLNLGGNDLEDVNGDVFAHLKHLKELIISSNLLSSVPKLENLAALETLDLSKNRIKKLHAESFNGLVSLINLSLKGNQVFYIEEDAFKGLVKLKYLNLEKNALDDATDITVVRTNLVSLKEIRINMNDFSCETLQSIIADFENNGVFVPEGLAEPGPISHHGMFCIPKSARLPEDNRDNVI